MTAIVCPGCGRTTDDPVACYGCWTSLPIELRQAMAAAKRRALMAGTDRDRRRYDESVAAMQRWFHARRSGQSTKGVST